MASSRKESSPYLGVQKSKSGGYLVEKRHFRYQCEDYGKFYHRTDDDESRAVFISDVVHFFSRTNESKFNFGNSRKVLEAHGPRLRRELEESLVGWADLDRKERRRNVRGFLIDEANKLWNEYKGEILKDHSRPLYKRSNCNVLGQVSHGHEDSVQEQDHSRPLIEGSCSNVVKQVNPEHEDSAHEQDQIRPVHKVNNNSTLEQLDHGYEECLAEWSMTKQFEDHFDDNGGFLKFDIDLGLLQQPPFEEPKLKKTLPIPPVLNDPQGSCSQTQENPYEGVDARGRTTEQNLVPKSVSLFYWIKLPLIAKCVHRSSVPYMRRFLIMYMILLTQNVFQKKSRKNIGRKLSP